MSETRYNIIFKGEILDGYDLEQIKIDLAHLFKKEPEQVEKLFAGNPVILKRNADRKTAQRYKQILEKTGVRCYLQSIQHEANQQTPSSAPQKPSSAPVLCQNCGYPLKPGEPCPQCILAASRAGQPPSDGSLWDRIRKSQSRRWHLYVVLGLTVVMIAYFLFVPHGTVGSDHLINRKFEFRSTDGPETPVRIAWDFSGHGANDYRFEYLLEEMNLANGSESDALNRRSLTVFGNLRIESQGDKTAIVIQKESKVYGTVDFIAEKFSVANPMGSRIKRRLYAGLDENGRIKIPESSSFPCFAILFQLPGRVLANGMTISRAAELTYTRQYIPKQLIADARFTLNDYVNIGDRTCARIRMIALFEEDPYIPFADEYVTVHCTLNLYWDLESRTVICGRMTLTGDTQYADAGYSGDYFFGLRTREILTYIHEDYLKECQ